MQDKVGTQDQISFILNGIPVDKNKSDNINTQAKPKPLPPLKPKRI